MPIDKDDAVALRNAIKLLEHPSLAARLAPRRRGSLVMRDLDETVRMIADRPLAEIIALLDREATVAEYAARRRG